MRYNPVITEESILQTCAKIAKKGETYHVNAYRYGEDNKRKACFRLKKQGRLKQGPTYSKLLTFYRPEDEPVLKAAREKHATAMRKIFKKNCYTMIEWARKEQARTGEISKYYIEQFWDYKRKAWHFTGEAT